MRVSPWFDANKITGGNRTVRLRRARESLRWTSAALVAVALFALCVPNAGASRASDARAALRRQFNEQSRGQYAKLWGELIPAQQRLIPKSQFVSCAQGDPGARIVRFAIVKTDLDPNASIFSTTGDSRWVTGPAVRIYVLTDRATGPDQIETYRDDRQSFPDQISGGTIPAPSDQFTEVQNHGTWRWAMQGPGIVDNYAGGCPVSETSVF